ncbi:MAG: 2OG-Fe(II) oxygenase family protein [Gemmatimonadales bacterium]
MSDKKQDGVAAVNQDFIKYDQVSKEHTYHLAESAGDELFDDDFEIRTCDMDQFFNGGDNGKARFAQELGTAMSEIGFAIIVGHGVDTTLYDDAYDRVIGVFTKATLDKKLTFRAQRFGSVSQGYFPIKETSDIHPDLVEGWVFCRRAFDMECPREAPYDPAEFWPDPNDEPFFRRIVQAHEQLILPLMQSALTYLGCDPHLYDRKLTGSNFGFRLNYYPPMDRRDDESGAGRLLGHEDVDLFTILPAPKQEGLQVFNRHNCKWIRLSAPPGSIILNTGDYMQRITNDIFPSTTHRVGKPRDGSHMSDARVSIPMAAYTWEDEVLEVLPCCGEPKYEPIKSITFHTRSTSKFYGDAYAVESSIDQD